MSNLLKLPLLDISNAKKCVHVIVRLGGFYIEEFNFNSYKQPPTKDHKRVIKTPFMSSNDAIEYMYFMEKQKEYKDYLFIYPRGNYETIG